MPVLMALIYRTEQKQARAVYELGRCGRPASDDARGTALFRWWLDLLDERHAELRIALNMKYVGVAPVLLFAGGVRSPYPEPACRPAENGGDAGPEHDDCEDGRVVASRAA